MYTDTAKICVVLHCSVQCWAGWAVEFSRRSICPRIGPFAVLMSSSIRQRERSQGNTFDLLAKLAMPTPYPSRLPALPNIVKIVIVK